MEKRYAQNERRLAAADMYMQMFKIAEDWKLDGTPWFKAIVLERELRVLNPELKDKDFYNRFRKFLGMNAVSSYTGGRANGVGPWEKVPPCSPSGNQHVYYQISDSIELKQRKKD